ncbi:inositol 2-dehydrogenase [Schaalia sp. Marseille-Q2122]|uniref:inositol 2-dehydrogenase n=1 Tax=Schaalia sp. Marseille-Q2122 TaxID=2736604 RepID=UPI00158B621E|nr:inositol 2-dehydrogenase [Schaalia sp. Marseille-Q2122]
MLRIALIGAGRIGQVHARSVAAHPHAQLALVADPFLENAQAVAAAYGARASDDVDAVFTDDEVDAVIICSPTPLHVPHILAAARAGKPALCEKPVAMETAAVENLRADLEGLDPVVMLGFNRRFDPSFRHIHDQVEAGAVGTLEQLTIISRDPAAPPKEYIAVSGGVFKDMTIHDFDMARYFLGEIVAVSAVGQNLDPELADTGDFDGVIITLINAEGHSATITNSRHCASGYDQRLEAFGTKGALFAENVRPTTVRYSTAEHTNAEDPYLDFFLQRYEAAYSAELSEFIAAITEGRRPSPDIEDGAAALRLAEAAEESARTGKVVRLD